MIWSPQQDEALRRVEDWIKDPAGAPFFYLAGFAGTGKTTLAKHFAESQGHVVYGAYTGKAAAVMREKGCEGATTIHRLIYRPSSKGTGRLTELQEQLAHEDDPVKKAQIRVRIRAEVKALKAPNFSLNEDADIRSADLVIIDECSMVGSQMGEDLLSFEVPILVLGDPAQLAPVGSTGFFTKGTPDMMLTEIHRQARESGILRLATDVREGRVLEYCDLGDAKVIRKTDLDPQDALGYDQIIVGRNKTRHATNKRVRELLGVSGLPHQGERLICLRNNHDLDLLNGEVYTAASNAQDNDETVLMSVSPEGDTRTLWVEVWKAPLEGEELEHWSHNNDVQEFAYGYVITAHKAQGSQYHSALVFDESRFFRADAQRWLYTAMTRASKTLTVVG